MLIVTCTNRKGGVLKTTLLFLMAVFFGNVRKKKVLVIDGDPAANASLSFKNRAAHSNSDTRILPALSEFLESDTTIEESAHLISVMPGDLKLAQLEHIDSATVIEAMSEIKNIKGFDLVLIDTAPSASNFVVAAKALSDYVMIPHTFDAYSAGGIEAVTEQLNALRQKGLSKADLLAIVPTRIDGSDKQQCQEVLDALEGDLAGYIAPPINHRRAGRHAMGNALAAWEAKTQSDVKKETLAVMAFLSKRLYPKG